MTAGGVRPADQITNIGLPLARLAKLWAAGTGIALLLVASECLVAQVLADPLVVAGAGEASLFHLVVAAPVIGTLARWLPRDRTPVEA